MRRRGRGARSSPFDKRIFGIGTGLEYFASLLSIAVFHRP
jgi:hypothetical protein